MKNEENVKIAKSKIISEDDIEDGEVGIKAATTENMAKDAEPSGHKITKRKIAFAAGKSGVIKKKNAEDEEEARKEERGDMLKVVSCL